MNNKVQQNKIIFLISQPRAGSTLTQKILGTHAEIFTASEPWVLLHPFTSLRAESHNAIYDSQLAQIGLSSFLAELPGGVQQYKQDLAHLYGNLYHQISSINGKQFFLDKTPRYYHIIPELAEAFPEAQFIILLRNPLAVFCSIINTWVKDRWLCVYPHRHDLLTAPKLLLDGIKLLGDRAIVLHYEQLLEEPEQQIRRVCQSLGVSFSPDLLMYGDNVQNRQWQLGDKEQVHQQKTLDSQNSGRWIETLNHPQRWRLVSDYLEFLGADTIHHLGYDYEQLRKILYQHRPNRLQFWNTMPLEWMLRDPIDFPAFHYGYLPVKLLNMLQQQSPLNILKSAFSHLFGTSFTSCPDPNPHDRKREVNPN